MTTNRLLLGSLTVLKIAASTSALARPGAVTGWLRGHRPGVATPGESWLRRSGAFWLVFTLVAARVSKRRDTDSRAFDSAFRMLHLAVHKVYSHTGLGPSPVVRPIFGLLPLLDHWFSGKPGAGRGMRVA